MTDELFSPGDLLVTQGAIECFVRFSVPLPTLLARHMSGDWGDLDDHDVRMNDAALRHGGRLFSAYGEGEQKVYIITESDRSSTTILRPEEY